MIHFDIVSIFPQMFYPMLEQGIIAKALKNNNFSIKLHQLRDFSTNKHGNIDDSSYAGGGQVMMIEPLVNAILQCQQQTQNKNNNKIIYMSPQGKTIDQVLINQLAQQQHLIIVCGRYEGVDERFITQYVDLELSIGDFVVSGGEIPTMLLIDAIVRQQPHVMNVNSVQYDSFMNGLLDFPHYTKPFCYNGDQVPDILLSGNHKEVEQWRRAHSIINTLIKRPDLLQKYKNNLTPKDIAVILKYLNHNLL